MLEMLKVFIADDEPKICFLIKKSIHWDELQLHPAGEFTDGTSLLKSIKSLAPDIVILDINMPGINGIDVIRETLQSGIVCHFIIISGYREFEYARSALKFGVSDYLLKPIDEALINEALQRIVSEILLEKKQSQKLHLGIAKSSFMSHILYEPDTIRHLSIQEANQLFHVDFRSGMYRILYFKCDTDIPKETENSISSIQKKIIAFLNESIGLLCYSIAHIQYKMMDVVVCINYASENSNAILGKLENLMKRINEQFEAFSITVTLGVSDESSKIQSLPDKCTEALNSIRQRLLGKKGSVILWNNCLCENPSSAVILSHKDIQTLQRAFTSRDETLFLSFMNTLKSNCASNAPHEVYDVLKEIVEISSETLLPGQTSENAAEYFKRTIEYDMHNAYSFSSLFSTVCDNITAQMRKLQDEEQEHIRKPVYKAKAYVSQHFNEDVKLETVATHVGLSSAYFSNLFKKTTGQNFIDFVTNYRLSIAKHLLESSDMTIGEITNAIGYDDQRYFSKLFRKEIGLTPSEYRKLYYR